ncbi:MAG: lipoprotein [Proteobacteria bacterium]|nr:lipoprotein [Pseudomonadota bacterium]
MKYIRKISDYMIAGGMGVLVIASMQGCDQKEENKNVLADAAKTQGALVIVDESATGEYKIAEEYPSSTTRVIVRKPDGSERILSQTEIDALVKEEAAKIDNNTSALTNPSMSSGQMGLGGILLSSIAGAMIGSWIGNKLFNNQNYQNQRAASYKSPQAYSRSTTSFNKPMTTTGTSSTSKSSGFFGSSSGSSTSSSGTTSSSTPTSSGS